MSNLALPGVGSLHAGRRIGWAQIALATSGFLLTLVFGGWFLAEWQRGGKLPTLVILENGGLPPHYFKFLKIGLAGMGLFGLALVWGILTSLFVYQEAKQHETR